MYINLKNKYLISVMIFLSILSSAGLLAEPKTWSKDESGRVLVYRAEPSKAVAVIFGTTTAIGLGISSMGFLPEIPSRERLELIVGFGILGSIISIPSALAFKYLYYDEYNALFKPLIVIDKHGISYEGHDKIAWKNICGYRAVQNIVYGEYGPVNCGYYIEISTDVARLEIPESRTAITWQKLQQLIDEAYKTYQKLEKENAVTAA